MFVDWLLQKVNLLSRYEIVTQNVLAKEEFEKTFTCPHSNKNSGFVSVDVNTLKQTYCFWQ